MTRTISSCDNQEEFEVTFVDEDDADHFMLTIRKGEVRGTYALDADQLTVIQEVIKAGLMQ